MALSLEKADNLTYQRYGRSIGQVPPTQLMRPWMDGLMGVFAIRKSDRNLVHEISRSCPVDATGQPSPPLGMKSFKARL